MTGRRSAVGGAERAIWPEHLVDKTFGSDILDLGQDRGFLLFGVEPLANGVVDKSHEAGRDDYAAIRISGMNESEVTKYTYSDTSFWLATIFSSAMYIEQGTIHPPLAASSRASEHERAIGEM